MIESVAILATIMTLLILVNLTHMEETNIESVASLRYASPKYASIARAVAPGIMLRAPMSRNQMEDVKRELNRRRWWVARMCETIDTKKSHTDATLTNMIIDT